MLAIIQNNNIFTYDNMSEIPLLESILSYGDVIFIKDITKKNFTFEVQNEYIKINDLQNEISKHLIKNRNNVIKNSRKVFYYEKFLQSIRNSTKTTFKYEIYYKILEVKNEYLSSC